MALLCQTLLSGGHVEPMLPVVLVVVIERATENGARKGGGECVTGVTKTVPERAFCHHF